MINASMNIGELLRRLTLKARNKGQEFARKIASTSSRPGNAWRSARALWPDFGRD